MASMEPANSLSLPNARPYAFSFPLATTALIVIDMQRDFVDPNGFGSIQCGNPAIFASVRNIVPTVKKVLQVARDAGMQVIHTREGHEPGLSDLPPSKKVRQLNAPHGHHTMGIGDKGPMGRLLVRGEYGHDIIDELRPLPDEVIIDKPGKGSFWGTGFHRVLLARGITHLLFTGVTTECCVTTTLRECNDRGYECCILSDCTGGFDQQQVITSMDTVCGQDGLFGYIGHSSDFVTQISASSISPKTERLGLPVEDEGFLSVVNLQNRYKAEVLHSGHANPKSVVETVFGRIEKYKKIDPAVWIRLQTKEEVLAAAEALTTKYDGKELPPLFGIPFAIKDNMDIAGIPTTAACEAYAYTPSSTAPALQLLLDAGALYIGKLNMDQFATGLSGCRSPLGTPHSVYSSSHISGGSSSGSGVSVAAGLISFSLGTDTAGSGRIPAGFNGLVGFKPTKGTISARGVVPACASLDTISIMAKSLKDARKVWYTLDVYDALDPYAKLPYSLSTWQSDFRGPKAGGFTFGVPPQSELALCSPTYLEAFYKAVATLRACGGTEVPIDYTPIAGASALLYDASLVHERIACIGHSFLTNHLADMHPTTRGLFSSALNSKLEAWQVFRDQGLQAKFTREADRLFTTIDVLVTPTAPSHPTIEEMASEPIACNAKVGIFTHAANVVDLCAVSVNAGFVEGGLPFGVQFLGGSGKDGRVLDIVAVFEEEVKMKKGMTNGI